MLRSTKLLPLLAAAVAALPTFEDAVVEPVRRRLVSECSDGTLTTASNDCCPAASCRGPGADGMTPCCSPCCLECVVASGSGVATTCTPMACKDEEVYTHSMCDGTPSGCASYWSTYTGGANAVHVAATSAGGCTACYGSTDAGNAPVCFASDAAATACLSLHSTLTGGVATHSIVGDTFSGGRLECRLGGGTSSGTPGGSPGGSPGGTSGSGTSGGIDLSGLGGLLSAFANLASARITCTATKLTQTTYAGGTCGGDPTDTTSFDIGCTADPTGSGSTKTTCANNMATRSEYASADCSGTATQAQTEIADGECRNIAGESPCFPGDATVVRESGATARLDELKPGDKIKAADASGGLYYDEVSRFSYADYAKEAAFVSLYTAKSALRLTAEHRVPVGESCCSTLKKAKDVAVGETVWVAAAGAPAPAVVTKVGAAAGVGVHNPLMKHGGYPLVDGVVTAFESVGVVKFASLAVPLAEALCEATGTCAAVHELFALVNGLSPRPFIGGVVGGSGLGLVVASGLVAAAAAAGIRRASEAASL